MGFRGKTFFAKYHSGTFAFHSDDIEYVFVTLDTRPRFSGPAAGPYLKRPDDDLLNQLRQNRDGAGLPRWPSYKDEGYPLIRLDSEVTSGPDNLRDRYLFLEAGMPDLHS